MKREAEASWASERVENALLRERINDVAAQIAQMTVVLEGPNSPIEAILAADSAAAKGARARPASPPTPRTQKEISPSACVRCRPAPRACLRPPDCAQPSHA